MTKVNLKIAVDTILNLMDRMMKIDEAI